ncbi:hypothetical protein OAO42_00040 [Candidatus Izimaplasma bacterium]|nr:hypothetical protein [Candidatus Izimaplasma bacterium]
MRKIIILLLLILPILSSCDTTKKETIDIDKCVETNNCENTDFGFIKDFKSDFTDYIIDSIDYDFDDVELSYNYKLKFVITTGDYFHTDYFNEYESLIDELVEATENYYSDFDIEVSIVVSFKNYKMTFNNEDDELLMAQNANFRIFLLDVLAPSSAIIRYIYNHSNKIVYFTYTFSGWEGEVYGSIDVSYDSIDIIITIYNFSNLLYEYEKPIEEYIENLYPDYSVIVVLN